MRGNGAMCVAVLALALGCGSSPYVCASSDQCVASGATGVCEPEGFCSFPDSACPSGRKFEPNAGGGLGGECVATDAPVPDAGMCGDVGQACCSGDLPCGHGGFCESGTCRECVTEVVPGRHANCLIKHDGTVWCAGENQYGQLGIGVYGTPVTMFSQARDAAGPIADATALGLGWEFACAVRTGGSVWCWGSGDDGQLGGGTASGANLAQQVQTAPNTPLLGIVELGAGYSHTCARSMAGALYCWGLNAEGQLGDGTVVPKLYATPVIGAGTADVEALTVGGHHACLRKTDGALWCWGKNDKGHFGDGSIIDRSTPVMVGTGTSVAAGRSHTCSVRADGTVWCAGEAWRNRLGTGAEVLDAYPTAVQTLASPTGAPLMGARQVVAGGVSCALMQDTSLVCWGTGAHGQSGTNGGNPTPKPVVTEDGEPLTGIDRVIAKFPHVCAHRATGGWWCWGRNTEGSLGDGTLMNRGVAMPVGFTCP